MNDDRVTVGGERAGHRGAEAIGGAGDEGNRGGVG